MAVPTPQVMVVPAPMAAPVATAMTAMTMPKSGGTINWAGFANPPSIDVICHTTFNGGMSGHVYNGFFAWNSDRSAALPQLVGEWSLADDAKSYTFTVRDGLTFHDGSPVTAADVVASTLRWGGSTHAIAKQVWDIINPVHTEVDDKTWRMDMSQTFGLWPVYQAFNGTWVQPASISGTVPPDECIDPETQAIGSGPYRFVEWVPGDRVVMERFFRYIPRSDERNGGGGAKIAYFDEIRMLVIPDASTQAAGLRTGQIHIANSVPGDFRSQLDADPDINVRVVGPASPPNLIFNKTAPPMNSQKARQAVLLAADTEAWMTASLGDGGDWILCGSVFMCDGPWATEAGTEKYFAPPNLEEARRLWNEALEEEGWDGQIVLLAANDIDYMDGGSSYTKQVLEQLHDNVSRPNIDWATVIQWKIKGCDKPIEEDSNTGWRLAHVSHPDGSVRPTDVGAFQQDVVVRLAQPQCRPSGGGLARGPDGRGAEGAHRRNAGADLRRGALHSPRRRPQPDGLPRRGRVHSHGRRFPADRSVVQVGADIGHSHVSNLLSAEICVQARSARNCVASLAVRSGFRVRLPEVGLYPACTRRRSIQGRIGQERRKA